MSSTTSSTTTPASAASAQEGYCRFVYGDTSNPTRIEVFTGNDWVALKGVSSVSPLMTAGGASPVVARIEFSDLTLVAASRIAAMSEGTAPD